MTAMPQPSLTPQPSPAPRASLEEMKIRLDALRVTIPGLNLGADAGMQMLAEEITSITASVGAAIALRTNDQILCRASVGQAPGVGAVLQPDRGLSGECVLTGKVVRCDDTDIDPRVNAQVCRDLGFRSVLISPIRLEERSIGLVELLAADAHHFNEDDVLFLNEIAAAVLELNGLKEASNYMEHTGSDWEPGDSESLDADFLTRFDVKNLMAALEDTSENPASMPETDDTMILRELEFIQNQNTAPSALRSTAPVVKTRTSRGPEPGSGQGQRKTTMISMLVLVLLALIGIGMWMWRARSIARMSGLHSGVSATRAARVVEPPANVGTAPTEGADTPAVGAIGEGPAGTGTVPAPHKRIPTLSPKKDSAFPLGASRPGTAPEVVPAPSIADLAATASNAPLLPSVAGLVTMPSNGPVLPRVSQPVSPVFQPTKVSSGLRGGTPIYQPRPRYPEMAKRNGLSGDVVLKFLVTKNGTVTNIRVVSGNPTLAMAAVQSVKLWRYRPFLLDGEPTETESQATIKFTSPR